jgi:hypothetical protein
MTTAYMYTADDARNYARAAWGNWLWVSIEDEGLRGDELETATDRACKDLGSRIWATFETGTNLSGVGMLNQVEPLAVQALTHIL